jgi:hypothetical protein
VSIHIARNRLTQTNGFLYRSANTPPLKKVRSEDGPPTKIVKCAKCNVHGWECDTKEPCDNCCQRKKATKCKRVMCKDYELWACVNENCGFAHEKDGYSYLTPHIKLPRNELGHDEPSKPNSQSVTSTLMGGDLSDGGDEEFAEEIRQAEDTKKGDGDDEEGGIKLPGP